VVLLGSALYLSNEERAAVSRISNLVSTVGIMSMDYYITKKDITFNKTRGVNESIADSIINKKKELNDLAQEQEKHTITLLTIDTNNDEMKKDMEKKVEQTRTKMDLITNQIVKLNIQDTNSKLSRCHDRNAQRLRDMCSINKGVYIKLGQHLCMLDYILPENYTTVLSTLLAQTPFSSWDDVKAVLQEDLLVPINTTTTTKTKTQTEVEAEAETETISKLFDSIEETPIASASLAQVHIAYKNGQKLAVKVQHRGLYENNVYDMWAITACLNIVSYLFDEFDYKWLSKEMNINLPIELNFNNELLNLNKAKLNLKSFIDSGDLIIPNVYESLSSKRVLTMTYEEGCYVNDVKSIKEQGLNPSHVASLVSKTFCEQIYRHGFVHCDPHEGNILVRKHKLYNNRPAIVLLDHGLYKELTPRFRLDYCQLWSSLIRGDQEGIKQSCINMNVGPAYTLLAAILTMKPWDQIVDVSGNNKSRNNDSNNNKKSSIDQAAQSEMLKMYAEKYMKDIILLLGRVDPDMLLLLKTNDCLRHLDKKLGTPINTMKIVGDITSNVLLKEELWPSNLGPRTTNGNTNGTNNFKREKFSEIYKIVDEKDKDKKLKLKSKSVGTAGDAFIKNLEGSTVTVSSDEIDYRPGGLLFWVHPRTTKALWDYTNLQIRMIGLDVVDWYLWLTGE